MKHDKSIKLYNEYKEYILPVIAFEKPIIESAKGMYVYDADGNEILDLNGGQFCTIFGHSHPEIKKEFDNINNLIQHTNTSTLTTQVLKAMKDVNEIMPELNPKSIFLATGSEAIEFAIRYAKHITGKNGLVCFDIGYHGLTLGSQSITYGGVHSKPIIDEIFSIQTPKYLNANDNYDSIIIDFEEICQKNSIAALVIEPVVSVGGMYPQRTDFINKLKVVCKKYGVLLVFDECQTGFGRTGEWFAYQKIGVSPDILVTAKGFGMGYPISMVSIDDKIVNPNKPIVHYSSHQNDPFSAMMISFGIDFIKRNDILSEVDKKGKYFFNALKNLSDTNKNFSKPRCSGLMIACDMQIDGISDYRKISTDFREYLLIEYNLMIQATNGGQTLRFLPSYLITEKQIDIVVEILDQSLSKFLKERG